MVYNIVQHFFKVFRIVVALPEVTSSFAGSRHFRQLTASRISRLRCCSGINRFSGPVGTRFIVA
jgi:hypothetical protein